MRRVIAVIFLLAAGLFFGAVKPVLAGGGCTCVDWECGTICDEITGLCSTRCYCAANECWGWCASGKYPCNTGCCDIDAGTDKPDTSGCGAYTWGLCRFTAQGYYRCGRPDEACRPCSTAPNPLIWGVKLQPQRHSLLVTWNRTGIVGMAQSLAWTDNKDNAGRCFDRHGHVDTSKCHRVALTSESSYTIDGVDPDGFYYVEVRMDKFYNGDLDMYHGRYYEGLADCPQGKNYAYYPPICVLTPESAELMAGESTNLTIGVYGGGGVNRVEFTNNNSGVARATTPDNSSPYNSTLTGIGGGAATITGQAYFWGG